MTPSNAAHPAPCFGCGLVRDSVADDLLIAPVTIVTPRGKLKTALCELCLRDVWRRARKAQRPAA